MSWKRNLSSLLTATPFAIMKGGTVVGHVPRYFSALLFLFLSKSQNKGVAEIMGMKVIRGAGYGNWLYGSRPYIERLKGSSGGDKKS